MLKMKKLILILLLMGMSTNVLAEWWFTLDISKLKNDQRISDEPMEFRLGPLSCGITKTEFIRINGSDQLYELRRLYCKSTDGTSFSVQADCNFPEYKWTQLFIERGAVKFSPTLKCGPRP